MDLSKQENIISLIAISGIYMGTSSKPEKHIPSNTWTPVNEYKAVL